MQKASLRNFPTGHGTYRKNLYPVKLSLRHILLFLILLCATAAAKPFLRVDIRNGMKVPRDFHVTGKTVPGAAVLIQVESWDGFGAEFEVFTDGKGYFDLPLSVPCKTVTTHVDILVRAAHPRRRGVAERKRYVIVKRH